MRRFERMLLVCLVALLAAALAGCGSDGGEGSAGKAAPGSEANPLEALPAPAAGGGEQPAGGGEQPASASLEGPASGGASEAPATHAVEPTGSPSGRKRAQQPPPGEAAPADTGEEPSPRLQKALPPSAQRPCTLVTKAQAQAILGLPVLAPIEAPQGPTCIYQSRSREQFIALSVQRVDFKQLLARLGGDQRVGIADRTGYCGKYGRQMLYVPLEGRRVLSVAAPCKVASAFAARALPRL